MRAGSYSGTSKAAVQGYSEDEPRIDKGKVTFRIASGKVRNFKVRGQQATCGGQVPDVDFKISSIKLSSTGKGSVTHQHEVMGPIKVTIATTSKGTATGKITYGGLCRTKATYTAKRKA